MDNPRFSKVWCKPQSPPPFNCVLVRVGDHVLHRSITSTSAITTKGNGRNGVYNTLFIREWKRSQTLQYHTILVHMDPLSSLPYNVPSINNPPTIGSLIPKSPHPQSSPPSHQQLHALYRQPATSNCGPCPISLIPGTSTTAPAL